MFEDSLWLKSRIGVVNVQTLCKVSLIKCLAPQAVSHMELCLHQYFGSQALQDISLTVKKTQYDGIFGCRIGTKGASEASCTGSGRQGRRWTAGFSRHRPGLFQATYAILLDPCPHFTIRVPSDKHHHQAHDPTRRRIQHRPSITDTAI